MNLEGQFEDLLTRMIAFDALERRLSSNVVLISCSLSSAIGKCFQSITKCFPPCFRSATLMSILFVMPSA